MKAFQVASQGDLPDHMDGDKFPYVLVGQEAGRSLENSSLLHENEKRPAFAAGRNDLFRLQLGNLGLEQLQSRGDIPVLVQELLSFLGKRLHFTEIAFRDAAMDGRCVQHSDRPSTFFRHEFSFRFVT